MRTLELSDETFGRIERAAAARGVSVDRLVEEMVEREAPERPESAGHRVRFPIFESKNPGALRITKETIDQAELEDDLRRSGLLGYE